MIIPDQQLTRKNVCIRRLGFVGSAVATAVAQARDEAAQPLFEVTDVDLPTPLGQKCVGAINAGRFPFGTSDPKLPAAVKAAHQRGNLGASTDPAVYGEAEVIIVDVHRDMPFLDDEPKLEFSGFEITIRAIGQHMRKDALVIVKTTVPPEICDKVVAPVLEEELSRRGCGAGLAAAGAFVRTRNARQEIPGFHYQFPASVRRPHISGG